MFGPDRNWYEKTWWTPDQSRRTRRRIAPVLVGAVCVILALASITVLQPPPSGVATVEIG